MKSKQGWDWFGDECKEPAVGNDKDLACAFARCFRGRDGARVAAYLRAITQERALGPNAPDALLRHVEGQRHLVRHIVALIDRGRA